MRISRIASSVSQRLSSSNHHTTFSSRQDVSSPSPSLSIAEALQEHINSPSPKPGKKIHADIIKTGFRPDLKISIKLLILHLKCGCLSYARQVFDEIPKPTLSAYNYMISGYLRQGFVKESLLLVQRMAYTGERADGYTLSMVLKASCSFGSAMMLPRSSLCRSVHARIVKCGVELDDVLVTALVDAYVKSGKLMCARTVFETMKDENLVCSTSMISGYMNQGFVEEAEAVFNATNVKDIVVYNAMVEGLSRSDKTAKRAVEMFILMQRDGFHPNISSFASVIGACSVLTGHEVGQQVHGQVMKTSVYTHIKMGSSLIDMYAKCGGIDDARRVFDQMQERNVFSWTSMIDGYGKNSNPERALELFAKMKEFNIQPNYVTFLGALSACSHSGLVDKGYEIFESMQRDYAMRPKMEHYACMVDLMGRAGELSKALEFVMAMPERPNSDVWTALLSSCKMHGNVDLAGVAANELFKLNAYRRPGAYIAISNVLASADKWDNVSEVREVMKARKIPKNIGRSWISDEKGDIFVDQESRDSPLWNLSMASLNSGIADSRRFTKTLNPLSFLLPASAYGKKKHGSMLPSNLFDSGKTVTGPPHPKSTVECPKYRQSVNPLLEVNKGAYVFIARVGFALFYELCGFPNRLLHELSSFELSIHRHTPVSPVAFRQRSNYSRNKTDCERRSWFTYFARQM